MSKLIIFILFFSFSAFADEIQLGKVQEFFKIDEIKVEGTKKVEPEAILEKIILKKGMSADNYSLRKDVKTIFEMKYFESVEAHQELKDGKNILIFKVKERPVISKIIFKGNEEVTEEELRDQIKTKEYQILDINTIKADLGLIQKFYEEKGYYLAAADYDIEKSETGGIDLTFKLKEYVKVRVKQIMFLGNKNIPDSELKTFMQTKEESLFSFFSGSGSFKDFNFQTDIERLKYLYKSRGFLQVNIGNPEITVSEDKKWIFITMKVKEGPKFSVNNIFFNGELLFTEKELREKVKLKSGETYSEETLRIDIQNLTEMYQDKGYAFANVLRTLEIVPGENKVDIHFSFEKGKIAYFGKIIIKGNNKTRDKVVRRELRIHEGMRFSGSLLRKSKENVNRLGFFEQNSVIFNTVSPKGKDDVLDVEISIKERQTGQITLGAGYSTATKGFLQASVAQNNFRGLGQNLNFNFSYASQQQMYNLGFTEPYFMDTKWTAGADIFKTRNSLIRSFASEKEGGDIRVGYPVFEYTRLFFTFRHEETKISNVRDSSIDPELENGRSISLSSSLNYDRRNNVFEPTEGYFGSVSAENAGYYGDQKWFKGTIEGRYYKPVYDELVFRSRLRTQQIWQTTERPVPRAERFYLGGARNMRGYNLEDLGPREELKDEVFGGTAVFNTGGLFSVLGTVELEHPLIKEAGLKWVVFYDVGNVYKTYMGEDGDYNLRSDYGFGFRWFSPIGVLRFEFGFPVDKKENEDAQQFHFDIGPYF